MITRIFQGACPENLVAWQMIGTSLPPFRLAVSAYEHCSRKAGFEVNSNNNSIPKRNLLHRRFCPMRELAEFW